MMDILLFFGLSQSEASALNLSLYTSIAAVLISLPLAVFIGWLLARHTFPGHGLLNALVHLPLVLPPVVVGYVLLIALGRNGVIGGFLYDTLGLRFAFTTAGVVIACAVVSFPLFVRAVRQAIESIDTRLERAAETLGAGRMRVFLTVTLPLTLPGILIGATLAFARSLGEFGATITFAANIPGATQTLPLALFTETQSPGGDEPALRMCLFSIALAFIAVGASEMIARRARLERRA